MSHIPISERTEGMMEMLPDYYQESQITAAILNAKALEYDRIESKLQDLELQLSPLTATWGLIYWEASVGLRADSSGDLAQRRPLVLQRLLGDTNFNADMIMNLARSYNQNVRVEVDHKSFTVRVLFFNTFPSFLEDFKAAVARVIHAHLALEVIFAQPVTTGIYFAATVQKGVKFTIRQVN